MDVLQSKFHKRGLDIKALDLGKVENPPPKGTVRQTATIRQGLDKRHGHAENRQNYQGQGALKCRPPFKAIQVRVSGKVRDDLQAVIAALNAADLGRAATIYQPYR